MPRKPFKMTIPDPAPTPDTPEVPQIQDIPVQEDLSQEALDSDEPIPFQDDPEVSLDEDTSQYREAAPQGIALASPQGVPGTLAPEALAAIVRAAIEAAQGPQEGLVGSIAQAIKGMGGKRRITTGERGVPKTQFNPEGRTRKMKRRYFVNTYEARERSLFDAEIDMLEKLQQGVYCGGKFKVAIVGEHSPMPEVHILWPNARPEDRVMIAREYGNFRSILGHILRDQESQEQERKDFAEYRAFKSGVPRNARGDE